MSQAKTIHLDCIVNGHNKTYRIQLVAQGSGWVVNTQHGPIGKALVSGTKTPTPVPYAKALAAYNKLVKAKLAKDYLEMASTGNDGDAEGDETAPASPRPVPKERVDLPIMLLNPISEPEGNALAYDPFWCAEIKHDGERRLIVIEGGDAYGVNRTGFKVPLSAAVRAAALAAEFRGRTILDAEDMGIDGVIVFDVLAFDGQDTTSLPLSSRLGYRDCARARLPGLRYAVTARATADKLRLLEQARVTTQEGVVWKRMDAPYSTGRPNSGGSALKQKFWEDATFRVASQHPTKRSVALEVQDANGNWIGVGNVTIPPNKPVPVVGALVDCQFLYAHRDGSIYQPIYLRERTDLSDADCRMDRLKFVDEREAIAA